MLGYETPGHQGERDHSSPLHSHEAIREKHFNVCGHFEVALCRGGGNSSRADMWGAPPGPATVTCFRLPRPPGKSSLLFWRPLQEWSRARGELSYARRLTTASASSSRVSRDAGRSVSRLVQTLMRLCASEHKCTYVRCFAPERQAMVRWFDVPTG